jgi:hypothetical protein
MLLYSIQTGPGARAVSYPLGIGEFSPAGVAGEADNSPPSVPTSRMFNLYFYSPCLHCSVN